ncbi:hypothetical protein BDW68DRAFT_177724 [Aspergillus falconensis]
MSEDVRGTLPRASPVVSNDILILKVPVGMKVCPHKALSVLSSLSTSILPYKAGPATASISVCCAALQSTSLSPSLYDSSSPTYHASQATYWRVDNT